MCGLSKGCNFADKLTSSDYRSMDNAFYLARYITFMPEIPQ